MFVLKRLLSVAGVYRAFQAAVGGRSRQEYIGLYLKPTPGMRVLDIGCGPGDILHDLDESVDYTGVDLSAEYIAHARRHFGKRGRFLNESVMNLALREQRCFDLVMANGVLHHLNDDEALHLLKIAAQALHPGGRLVTIDGCYTPEQSKLARWVVSRDRGEYIRPAPAFVKLAKHVFADVSSTVRYDLLRIPYTHLIMECQRSQIVDMPLRAAC